MYVYNKFISWKCLYNQYNTFCACVLISSLYIFFLTPTVYVGGVMICNEIILGMKIQKNTYLLLLQVNPKV